MAARKRGLILYTASVSSLGASTSYAHYGASKAGIVNLAKTMALELVDLGIRVNAVSPGPLDTPNPWPSWVARRQWSGLKLGRSYPWGVLACPKR